LPEGALTSCSTVTGIEFPVPLKQFPVPLNREFRQKPERRQGSFGPSLTANHPKSRKFPVFSLMIWEFDSRELFVSDCAIRHAVRDFRSRLGKSKIAGMFAVLAFSST
jgi:hypothetical protein